MELPTQKHSHNPPRKESCVDVNATNIPQIYKSQTLNIKSENLSVTPQADIA